MIRPGLSDRLEWMAKNVYISYRCGLCYNGVWCDKCMEQTLKSNVGKLPSKWNSGKRVALEEFITRVANRKAT